VILYFNNAPEKQKPLPTKNRQPPRRASHIGKWQRRGWGL